MEKWLREYITKFARQSIYYYEMQSSYETFVRANYATKDANNLLAKIDWNTWVKKPGLPPVILDFKTPEYEAAKKLADDYIAAGGNSSPSGFEKYKDWVEGLKSIFNQQLLDKVDKVTAKIVQKIDTDLAISNTLNPEIKYLWYQVRILSKTEVSPFSDSDKFVGSIGRMKFIVPIYKAIHKLANADSQRIYARYKDFYHPMA